MFVYLTTDTQVLGLLAWASSLVTLAGFIIAIDQIRRVKRSADAARDAARDMIRTVQGREMLLELKTALSHLDHARNYLGRRSYEAAAIHLDFLKTAVIQVRELTIDDAETHFKFGGLILRISKVHEASIEDEDLPDDDQEPLPLIFELGKIADILNEVSAHYRYRYETREMNP